MNFLRKFFKKHQRDPSCGEISRDGGDTLGFNPSDSPPVKDQRSRKNDSPWSTLPNRGLLRNNPSTMPDVRTSCRPSGSETLIARTVVKRAPPPTPSVYLREVKMSSNKHVAQILPDLLLGRCLDLSFRNSVLCLYSQWLSMNNLLSL